MSQQNRNRGIAGPLADWGAGPSEPASFGEHQAALDATVFRASGDPYELVLELEAGELRIRRSQGA